MIPTSDTPTDTDTGLHWGFLPAVRLRHAPGHPGEIAAVDGNGKIRHHFTVLDNADVLDACKGLSITVARGFPDMVQRLRAAGATASMGDSRDPVALAREAGSGVLWL